MLLLTNEKFALGKDVQSYFQVKVFFNGIFFFSLWWWNERAGTLGTLSFPTDLQHSEWVHQTSAISTLELFINHQSELIWEYFHIL